MIFRFKPMMPNNNNESEHKGRKENQNKFMQTSRHYIKLMIWNSVLWFSCSTNIRVLLFEYWKIPFWWFILSHPPKWFLENDAFTLCQMIDIHTCSFCPLVTKLVCSFFRWFWVSEHSIVFHDWLVYIA